MKRVRYVRWLGCLLTACAMLTLFCGCEDGDAPASWTYKYAATVEDAYDFVNGFVPYAMPRASASIVAAGDGFYVFYREELVGTSDWNWKREMSSSNATAFLNGEDSVGAGPVADALVAYRSAGEMYVFSRGLDPDAVWKQQDSADTADALGLLNGAGEYWMPRDGAVCGNASNEIVTFFRDDKWGSPDWQMKLAMSPDQVSDLLNGIADGSAPAADAEIFAAADGSFVIYYRSGSGD